VTVGYRIERAGVDRHGGLHSFFLGFSALILSQKLRKPEASWLAQTFCIGRTRRTCGSRGKYDTLACPEL
jgi:hypothetical protein